MEDKIKISKINFNTIFQYEAGHLYWKVKPCKKICIGDKAGTYHTAGYWHITINKKKYLSHRLIYLYHYGYMPEVVDHINKNSTDNRIENLREASFQLNQYNRKLNIHHIDYNKQNCNEENLITLCDKCHCRTNFNRDYWFTYFTELLKGAYNLCR